MILSAHLAHTLFDLLRQCLEKCGHIWLSLENMLVLNTISNFQTELAIPAVFVPKGNALVSLYFDNKNFRATTLSDILGLKNA